MRTRIIPVIINGSMAADIASELVSINQSIAVGVHMSWTGTPTGTVGVEIAGNYDPDVGFNITNETPDWIPVTASQTSISGAVGKSFYEYPNPGASVIRVVYTKGSSTGTLNAWVVVRGY